MLGPVDPGGAAHLRQALRENWLRWTPTTAAPRSTSPSVPRAALLRREQCLSEGLRELREALRERLPRLEVAKDQPRGLSTDQVVAADEHRSTSRAGSYREGDLARLTAVTPEGERVEILDTMFTYERPDVEQFYGATRRGRREPDGVHRIRRDGA